MAGRGGAEAALLGLEGAGLIFWWPQRARACEASDHPVMGRLEVD